MNIRLNPKYSYNACSCSQAPKSFRYGEGSTTSLLRDVHSSEWKQPTPNM